jgi:two-component sensor histidine kinase
VARLQALARANGHVLKSDWSGVGVHELVETELEPFRTNVAVDGITVLIRPEDAQNLSLALHELATNATKYGALSNAAGKVHISWRIMRGDNPTLRFRWREAGGPPVVPPDRQGFGTTMLKGMFTDVRIDYLEEGLNCEFQLQLLSSTRFDPTPFLVAPPWRGHSQL